MIDPDCVPAYRVAEILAEVRALLGVREPAKAPNYPKRRTKGNALELTGRTFGRLTVLYSTRNKRGDMLWHCRCICGEERDVKSSALRHGLTRSCGCLRKGRGHPRQLVTS